MAAIKSSSGGSNRVELDDMTTCCICTEVYTDPKALPCIHTFCMKCLQETGLKTNKGPGDEMPCPICRRLFKIPSDGIRGLTTNFFIERLIQVSTVSDPSAVTKALCSVCLEESREQKGKEIATADTYCVECKHKLCEECCSEHRKFKLTKNHKLMPINKNECGQNVTTDLVPNVCDVHEQMVLNVYCADCKRVVCAICFIEDHNNHKGSQVSKCVGGFRKQIQNNTEAMNGCIAEAHMKKAELMKVKEEMQRRVESLECDVEKRKDYIKQLTDRHASSLLQGLCSERQGRLKEIQMATDAIDAYLLTLESYNSYCKRLIDKGSASDICRTISDLSIRAFELEQQCQPTSEIRITDFRFCFRRSELEEFLEENRDNLVGEIEAELRYKSDPVLVQTIRTQAEEKGIKWIRGMTILDKELFVLSETNLGVEVYDTMKLSLSRRWKLRELVDAFDIGSCNRNKCLYISNGKCHNQLNAIFRVDGNGNLIKNWSTGYDYGRLSVTDESNVILTACNKYKLNEYSPDGKLLREINLLSGAGIHVPYHAIKLKNGYFVVSHSNGGDLHRVCIVSVDGKLKKSFGGKRGSTIGQLDHPSFLCVDGNGFVIVVDQLNHRILLLDQDLELKREILSMDGKHGLQATRKILLDETNGRLLVATDDPNNPRILIFDIRVGWGSKPPLTFDITHC